MPDLSAGFDLANPYGLLAADFSYDMDSYAAALRFLSDVAGGTEEPKALEVNGGTSAMKRDWERSGKFRRVLDKCRRAGEAEREADAARRAAEEADEAEKPSPLGQRFIPLEEAELPPRRTYSLRPRPDQWGG